MVNFRVAIGVAFGVGLMGLPPTIISRPVSAAPTRSQQKATQYIFLNRAPGRDYNQNRPETISDTLFTEPMAKGNAARVNTRGTSPRRLGLSFILSYLDGPPAALEASLRRLLSLSEQQDVPVLIVLDGQNWWGYRSDLWNWWDVQRPGYNPKNAWNVEWTGWGPQYALKIAWRNWGQQIRVLPPPNLASPHFRAASQSELRHLVGIIKQWADQLPPQRRYLFPGVKIGWEASLGVNAYYYPDGNHWLEAYPDDASHDPRSGLDMNRDFAGGLMPLGYAALQTKRWKTAGTVTLADQERITTDYLSFLSHVCRKAGLRREEIFTHAGGQFAPWEKHYTHAVAINRDALPGWSLYGHLPAEAGDLGESLHRAGLEQWAVAEWLPNAHTAEQWQAAYNQTLGFKECRFISVYNWEGIRDQPAAIEGLRLALMP